MPYDSLLFRVNLLGCTMFKASGLLLLFDYLHRQLCDTLHWMDYGVTQNLIYSLMVNSVVLASRLFLRGQANPFLILLLRP